MNRTILLASVALLATSAAASAQTAYYSNTAPSATYTAPAATGGQLTVPASNQPYQPSAPATYGNTTYTGSQPVYNTAPQPVMIAPQSTNYQAIPQPSSGAMAPSPQYRTLPAGNIDPNTIDDTAVGAYDSRGYAPAPYGATIPQPVNTSNQGRIDSPMTAAPISNDISYLSRPEPQTAPSGITFISGGIGDWGQSDIKQLESTNNLKLMTAATGGAYLADVTVSITSSKGEEVLNTVTEGPFLLANLKPGTYMVKASYEGQTQTQKITVGKGLKTQNFYFRASEV